MLTNDQPWAAKNRDSALVEKRGPSITTIVPPTTGVQPELAAAAAAAERAAGQ
jgi:hypothetical protein